MGACKTKVHRKQDSQLTFAALNNLRIKTDFNATQDTRRKRQGLTQFDIERCLTTPLSCGYMLSNRQQTKMFGMKDYDSANKTPMKGLGLVISLNASKKYTQIQKRQINEKYQVLENNKNGQIVEMETLPKSNPQSAKYVEWLINAEMDHPNIIRLLEVYQTQDSYQLIYEHFDGAELSELISEENKTSKQHMSLIVDQMLQAMSHIHSLKKVHGHLSLSSFRIKKTSEGEIVKLIDLSRLFIKNNDNENIEELKFFPPECVYHPDRYSRTRDVWAIGLLAYTIRKGKILYKLPSKEISSYQDVQISMEDQGLKVKKKKDKTYEHFLNSALAHDPKSRKTCSDLLSHPFIMKFRTEKKAPQLQLLQNLLHAKSCCLLQELLLGYFLQEFNWDEFITIKKLFYEGDQDMDGLLNKQEILKLFTTYDKEDQNIEHQIDEIFGLFELEKVGGMNMQHFQAMTANRTVLLTKENIEICFYILSSHKPDITLKQLKRHLNYDSKDLIKEFAKMTDEVNELTFQQFEKLMKLLL